MDAVNLIGINSLTTLEVLRKGQPGIVKDFCSMNNNGLCPPV